MCVVSNALCYSLVATAKRAAKSWVHEDESQRRRLLIRAGLGSLVIVALLVVPLPATLRVSILWEPDQGLAVSNTIGGRVVEVLPPNTVVQIGDVLARLENPELLLTVQRLQGDIATHTLRVENLRRRQNDPLLQRNW